MTEKYESAFLMEIIPIIVSGVMAALKPVDGMPQKTVVLLHQIFFLGWRELHSVLLHFCNEENGDFGRWNCERGDVRSLNVQLSIIRREDRLPYCQAAFEGDWEAAQTKLPCPRCLL